MVAKTRLASLLIAIAFAAVACQGNSVDSTPAPPAIQWQRVTFVASRLHPGFAMDVPQEWQYQVTETGIIVVNHPSLLALPDEGTALPSGSLTASVSILSAEEVQSIGARNAAGILDFFVGTASGESAGPQYSNSTTIQISGRDVAQSFVSIAGSDSLILAMELSGHYVLGVVIAPKGELRLHADLLNQIFASFELRFEP